MSKISVRATAVICSLILSVSFITGCYLLGQAYGAYGESAYNKTVSKEREQPFEGSTQILRSAPGSNGMMNLEETAAYMNLSEEQVRYIISSENKTLDTLHSLAGERFPHIVIRGEIYTNPGQLDLWMMSVTKDGRRYDDGIVLR